MWTSLGRTFGEDYHGSAVQMFCVKVTFSWSWIFWDTATTISPIWKDVKHHHTRVKTFEDHPTHLQETHVFASIEVGISLCLHCLCQSLVMFLLQCTCDVTQEICNYLSLRLYSKVVAIALCCAFEYLWALFCTCQSTWLFPSLVDYLWTTPKHCWLFVKLPLVLVCLSHAL